MSRNRRRPVAIAVAGVFAVAPLVSACAAGQHPESAYPTQLAEGVNAVANGVYVRNVFLLGPEPGQRLAAGGSAPLYAWFVNKTLTQDRLIAVETSGVAQSAEIAGGAVVLPPGDLVTTVQPPGAQAPVASPTPAASKTPAAKPAKKPAARRTPAPRTSGTAAAPAAPVAPAAPQPSKIVLKGLTKDLLAGQTVRLVLHFQRAGALALNVEVTPRSGYYATYSPVPVPPTPSATPLPSTPKAAPSSVSRKSKKKPVATPSA